MKARVAYLVETGVIESKTVVAGKYDGRQQKKRSHATSCWVRRNSKLANCSSKKDVRVSRPPPGLPSAPPAPSPLLCKAFSLGGVLRTYYEYVGTPPPRKKTNGVGKIKKGGTTRSTGRNLEI